MLDFHFFNIKDAPYILLNDNKYEISFNFSIKFFFKSGEHMENVNAASKLMYSLWVVDFCKQWHNFQQYIRYMMIVSFTDRGNRKPKNKQH